MRRRLAITIRLPRKEAFMHYKTIILHLLEQRPQIYEQLRKERMLLPTLERFARELKAEEWKDRLSQTMADTAQNQIASQAMEIALKEIEDSLPSASPPNDSEPISLDEAMASIRPTPPV
jgi:hypothetical protein